MHQDRKSPHEKYDHGHMSQEAFVRGRIITYIFDQEGSKMQKFLVRQKTPFMLDRIIPVGVIRYLS